MHLKGAQGAIVARGDTRPNAGILLMTKEARESGNVIRAFTTVKLYAFH